MNSPLPNRSRAVGSSALLTGGLAAILASACCLGPLLLITLGFSGAWIGSMSVLGPYRPIFIGVAVVALFFSWQRLWRPAAVCAPTEICAVPRVKRAYKLLFGTVIVLVLIAIGFPYVAPWFY
jgi:mercuric ion transport protein